MVSPNRQYESMLTVARERLSRHAPESIARRAGVTWDGGRLTLPSLGQTVTVTVPDFAVSLVIRRQLGLLPPEELRRRCLALGAELLPSNADLCARFPFLPRYPLWLRLWFGDEEFPASGRLFLDESAAHYLTVEDAVTVGGLLLERLAGGPLLG